MKTFPNVPHATVMCNIQNKCSCVSTGTCTHTTHAYNTNTHTRNICNRTVRTYHYHLAEQFGYVDSEGHVGDDFLDHLKVALRVPMDFEATQQGSLEKN